MNKNKKDNNEKCTKFQYSKLIVIISLAIFIWCLYKGFNMDFATVVDTTFYVAAITTSGTISATAIVWYLKKSQTENSYKLKSNFYKIASQERINYNKEMLELQKKYNVTQDDINEIEGVSYMDELEQEALDDVKNSLDSSINESTSTVEIQQL